MKIHNFRFLALLAILIVIVLHYSIGVYINWENIIGVALLPYFKDEN